MYLIEKEAEPDRLVNLFGVKECLDPNFISMGIAKTEQDKEGRLKVVTERYLDPKISYILPTDLNEQGLYVDEYEQYSIPLVAKIGCDVVGSLRLIPNIPNCIGLPINNEPKILIDGAWKQHVLGASYELSQFANSMSHRKDNRIAIGLIKAYMGIVDTMRQYTSVAIIDDRVAAILNGPYSGFNLPKIGPSVYYVGSASTPVYININDGRQNSRLNGHPELADFLSGRKNISGFEWYIGP